VKSIFLNKLCELGEVDDLFKCHTNDYKCAQKETLYCLGSELIRMRNTSWEHYVIQCCLLRISYCAKVIEDSCSRERGFSERRIQKRFSDELIEVLEFMKHLALTFLLRRKDNKNVGLNPIHRIQHFLKYRLQVAYKWQENGHRFECGSLHGLAMRVDNFVEWLTEILSNRGDFIEGLKSEKNLNELTEYGDFCENVAKVLEQLGRESYKQSHDVIMGRLNNIQDIRQLDHAISLIIRELPHNDLANQAIRIWKRKDEERFSDESIYGKGE